MLNLVPKVGMKISGLRLTTTKMIGEIGEIKEVKDNSVTIAWEDGQRDEYTMRYVMEAFALVKG